MVNSKGKGKARKPKGDLVARFHALAMTTLDKVDAIVELIGVPRSPTGDEWEEIQRRLPAKLKARERWNEADDELARARHAHDSWTSGRWLSSDPAADVEQVWREFERAKRTPEATTHKLEQALAKAQKAEAAAATERDAVHKERKSVENKAIAQRVRVHRASLVKLCEEYEAALAPFRHRLGRVGGYPRMGRFENVSSACAMLLVFGRALANGDETLSGRHDDRIETDELRREVEGEIAERLGEERDAKAIIAAAVEEIMAKAGPEQAAGTRGTIESVPADLHVSFSEAVTGVPQIVPGMDLPPVNARTLRTWLRTKAKLLGVAEPGKTTTTDGSASLNPSELRPTVRGLLTLHGKSKRNTKPPQARRKAAGA